MELHATRNNLYMHVSLHGKGNLGCNSSNYSKVQDAAQIYELKTKIHDPKQGTLSIHEYYSVI